jgi:ribose 5-phosphate isomerase A
MSPEDKKRIAAEAAVDYVRPDSVIGVGTGSTVNHFIDLLADRMGAQVRAAVSSSEASSERENSICMSTAPTNPTPGCS